MATHTAASRLTDLPVGRDAALHTPLPARLILTLGPALLIISLGAAIAIGASDLGLAEIARSIGARLGADVAPLTALQDAVIWQLRGPRVLLAAVVGAGLALCGVVLQSLTRNPLADPYLLGVSSGASTGAVCVLVLGVGSGAFALAGGAFIGAIAAFAVVVALAGRFDGTSARIVLAGVAVSQFFAATTSLITMAQADNDSAKSVLAWLLGSLASANWTTLSICTLTLVVTGIAVFAAAPTLDAFAFGRETAASLGISPGRASLSLFVITALLTAVLVSASGAIGFVGLVIPHIARMMGARRHRLLLPASAVLGALFLVWADVFSRVAFAPQQIPVGVVTALVGVPVFAILMRARRERAS